MPSSRNGHASMIMKTTGKMEKIGTHYLRAHARIYIFLPLIVAPGTFSEIALLLAHIAQQEK